MNGDDIKKSSMIEPFGLVLGNEGNGVSSRMRSLCNGSISLSMKNNLESLNVGVAGAIIMYYFTFLKN